MVRILPWNIPNTISAIRIMLVPLFLSLLFNERYGAALCICLAAGISDVADGYIARRFNRVTKLGSILDPVADKVLVIGSVVVLTHLGLLPRWVAVLIVTRDILILAGAGYRYLAAELPPPKANLLGKLSTFLQLNLIFTVLLKQKGIMMHPMVISTCCIVTSLATVISGAMYLIEGKRELRQEMSGKTGSAREFG